MLKHRTQKIVQDCHQKRNRDDAPVCRRDLLHPVRNFGIVDIYDQDIILVFINFLVINQSFQYFRLKSNPSGLKSVSPFKGIIGSDAIEGSLVL